MKRVLVFPGQGNQKVGMFDKYLQFAWAKDMLNQANSACGFDLVRIAVADPDKNLDTIEKSSPAVFTASMLELELWKRLYGVEITNFSALIGQSLGEYTAACASGCFTFSQGVQLASIRGQAMANCILDFTPAVATLKAMQQQVETFIGDEPDVEIALVNSPTQTIISGKSENVQNVLARAKKEKIRSLILNIKVPSHNSLMEKSAIAVTTFLESTIIKPAKVPVYSGAYCTPNTHEHDIKASLADSIWKTALFWPAVEDCIKDGAEAFAEANENKVTLRIVKAIVEYKNMLDRISLDN